MGLERSDESMVGRHARPAGRRPKVVEDERECSVPGCSTKLNRYNRSAKCFIHQGRRFPRVRGRR